VKEKVAYGLENALNYSRDDFHEDGRATTIRLIAWHALFIPMRVPHADGEPLPGRQLSAVASGN
jgi:hypothetical protein